MHDVMGMGLLDFYFFTLHTCWMEENPEKNSLFFFPSLVSLSLLFRFRHWILVVHVFSSFPDVPVERGSQSSLNIPIIILFPSVYIFSSSSHLISSLIYNCANWIKSFYCVYVKTFDIWFLKETGIQVLSNARARPLGIDRRSFPVFWFTQIVDCCA